MKRETYMFGVRGEQYGIWNSLRKCWQFGICEDTPMLAEARLFQKIGDDARKFRFEARPLPPELRKATPEPLLMAELQRKDRVLKQTRHELRSAMEQLKKLREAEAFRCASCGRLFLADEFMRSEGLEVFGGMITGGEPICCPECHRKAVENDEQ